jgi:flagellar hook-length control protein FliK
MSVNIVSTLPKQAPAAAAETAAGNAGSGGDAPQGQDFADLLLGQLVPAAITDILPQIAVKKDSPETDPAAGDAAALLAAMGFVAPEPARATEAALVATDADSAVVQVDTALSDTLPALKAGIPLAPNQKATAESLAAQPALSASAAPDDKAAKFAVAALAPSVESIAAKSIAPDDAAQMSQATLAVNGNSVRPDYEVSLSIRTPLRDQNWAGDFGQKVVWLASSDKQLAQLTLNPPQMGPIEISLSLDKANATASFVSANADVRSAIESAMPRLREMFASAGINLGQTNVSAESFRQQAGNGEGYRPSSQWTADNAILVADAAGSARSGGFAVQRGNGMVDIFA